MNVYFLCKRFYTNKDLIEDRFGRLFHLPVQLAGQGMSVTVVALDYRNRTKITMNESGVIFHTIPTTPTKLANLFFTLLNSVRKSNPDVIIASGDSHIGFMGLQLSRLLRIRFVFDVYDYYPAFPGNRIPGMKMMFRTTVKNADLLLCASDSLIKKLTKLNRKVLLVENGVDRALFSPEDMANARKVLNLDQKTPIVGFFGSLASCKGPLLIEACRILLLEMPALKLLLAGKVTNVNIDKPWIIYLGELPQSSIPKLIAACNVVAVPLANHPQNDLSSACKIAEYLACSKPVVATRVSSHEQLFIDVPDSLCDPCPDDMARAILHQIKTPCIAQFPESMDWTKIGQMLFESLKNVRKL